MPFSTNSAIPGISDDAISTVAQPKSCDDKGVSDDAPSVSTPPIPTWRL